MGDNSLDTGYFRRNREVLTVLVVEDDSAISGFIALVLELNCLRAVVAGNGQEAAQFISEHKKPIHLLIVDVVLPGLDGIQVAKKFGEHFPNGKTIFITGWPDTTLPAGAVVLRKPFALQAFLEHVIEALRSITIVETAA